MVLSQKKGQYPQIRRILTVVSPKLGQYPHCDRKPLAKLVRGAYLCREKKYDEKRNRISAGIPGVCGRDTGAHVALLRTALSLGAARAVVGDRPAAHDARTGAEHLVHRAHEESRGG